MTANELLMQFQADVLGVPVVRPAVTETTALGAAFAAGLASASGPIRQELRERWREDRRWEPRMDAGERERELAQWRKAVERSLGWAESSGSEDDLQRLAAVVDRVGLGASSSGMWRVTSGAGSSTPAASIASTGSTCASTFAWPPRSVIAFSHSRPMCTSARSAYTPMHCTLPQARVSRIARLERARIADRVDRSRRRRVLRWPRATAAFGSCSSRWTGSAPKAPATLEALGDGVDREHVRGARRRARPAPRTARPARGRARRRRRRGACRWPSTA